MVEVIETDELELGSRFEGLLWVSTCNVRRSLVVFVFEEESNHIDSNPSIFHEITFFTHLRFEMGTKMVLKTEF